MVPVSPLSPPEERRAFPSVSPVPERGDVFSLPTTEQKITELEEALARLREQATTVQAKALQRVEGAEQEAHRMEEEQFRAAASPESVPPAATPSPIVPALSRPTVTDLRRRPSVEQVRLLLGLASRSLPDTVHAVALAEKLGNGYVIDALHDALVQARPAAPPPT